MRPLVILSALPFLGLPQVAAAQDDADKREAPGYYVEAVAAINLAQRFARRCPELTVEFAAAEAHSVDVVERLIADGFDMARLEEQMIDPSERLDLEQDSFLASRGLGDASPDAAYCAVARAEMSDGTLLGSYFADPEG